MYTLYNVPSLQNISMNVLRKFVYSYYLHPNPAQIFMLSRFVATFDSHVTFAYAIGIYIYTYIPIGMLIKGISKVNLLPDRVYNRLPSGIR